MHELDLVDKIIALITDQAKEQGFTTVREAHLRIGKMNGLVREHFTSMLTAQKEGPLASAELIVNDIPVELFCYSCGNCYIDTRFDDAHFAHATSHAPHLYLPPPCPECGGEKTRIISGTEMKLVSIEGE